MAEIIHEDGSITVGLFFDAEPQPDRNPEPEAPAEAEEAEQPPAAEPEEEPQPEAPAEAAEDSTRAQLVEQARAMGLSVPSKATKAQIIAMINEAEEVED